MPSVSASIAPAILTHRHPSFAVYYTGAAMNTARAFGPAVITGFPDNYHWIVSPYHPIGYIDSGLTSKQYWLGPFLGSLLGTSFYAILKQ